MVAGFPKRRAEWTSSKWGWALVLSHLMVLRAWCGSRIPAVEPSLSVSFQFSERLRPPLFPPFYPAYSSVFERHSPKKANSFPRQFCCINIYKSRFFARRKQARASWLFSPLQGTGVARPQPEPSPPPGPLRTEQRCTHHFVRTRAFHPYFVLLQSSQLRREGSESKTKAPGAHQSRRLP